MPNLTTAQAIEHITDTLGSGKASPRVGALRILNDAGEYLCSSYAWAWLQGKRVALDLESGQDFVWLPEDFREITGINIADGINSGLRLTTVQELIDLRTSALMPTGPTNNWVYWAAIVFAPKYAQATGTVTFTDVPADDATIILDDGVNAPVEFTFDTGGTGLETGDALVDISDSGQTASSVAAAFQDAIMAQVALGTLQMSATVSGAVVSLETWEAGTQGNVTITTSGTPNATISGMSGGRDGGNPCPRLEIWPIPGGDTADGLFLYYRAGWETLDEDSHYVSLPVWLHTLYLQLVRAFARGYAEEDVGSISRRCMEVMAGPLAAAARRLDSQMQPLFGEIRASAAEMMQGRTTPFFSYGPLSDPS